MRISRIHLLLCCLAWITLASACTGPVQPTVMTHLAPVNTPAKMTPAMVTPAPLPSLTAFVPTASQTPLPTSTFAPSASATQADELVGPLIAFLPLDTHTVELFDRTSGRLRSLELSDGSPSAILGWSGDGCLMRVRLGSRMEEVDIQGHMRQSLVDLSSVASRGSLVDIALSPLRDTVAYVVGTGYHSLLRYQLQNVEIANVDGSDATQITEHGGASNVVWSPDGQSVAYSDYDKNGVQQIFVTSPSKKDRRQLSSLSERSSIFGELQWSPSGNAIAVAMANTATKSSTVAILQLASFPKLEPLARMTNVGGFWWVSDHQILADVLPSNSPGSSAADRSLVLIDTALLDYKVVLEAQNTVGGIIEMAHPLDQDQVGFFSGLGFYSLDLQDGTVSYLMERFADLKSWSAGPNSFVGEAACRQ